MKKKELQALLITALCKAMWADSEIITLNRQLSIAKGRLRYGMTTDGISKELCKETINDIDGVRKGNE